MTDNFIYYMHIHKFVSSGTGKALFFTSLISRGITSGDTLAKVCWAYSLDGLC